MFSADVSKMTTLPLQLRLLGQRLEPSQDFPMQFHTSAELLQ